MILKKASIENVEELSRICVEAYSQSFHTHWEAGGLDWYLEKEFSHDRLRADLSDEEIEYFFIQSEDKAVGFIKTQENSLPNFPKEEGRELVKMYVLPETKGKGYGKAALQEIINRTRDDGKKILFLCVIDTNKSAIAFYEKLGFRYHSSMRLDLPYFKDELRGMNRMYRELEK